MLVVLSSCAYAEGVKLGMLTPVKLILNIEEVPQDFSKVVVCSIINSRQQHRQD